MKQSTGQEQCDPEGIDTLHYPGLVWKRSPAGAVEVAMAASRSPLLAKASGWAFAETRQTHSSLIMEVPRPRSAGAR